MLDYRADNIIFYDNLQIQPKCAKMRLTLTLNSKSCKIIPILLTTLLWSTLATSPVGHLPQPKASFASQKIYLLKKTVNSQITRKYRSSSPFSSTFPAAYNAAEAMAENCSNGIDDDGDGFIDGADPDCGCLQTIMMVARDNGQILSVNLATGGSSSVATSSPYVTGNLNALAANADKNLVYYCSDKKVYYWVPATGMHGTVFDLNGYIGNPESLSSGGGEYYNGYLYLGTENGNPGKNCKIWRLQLSADGKSGVGAPVDLDVPIPSQLSWGDMVATSEGGQTIIYGMAAAGTSFFFKYNVATTQYTLIRNDLPTEMQIGVDIQGNTWAGSLSSGSIQKINRTTGYFYGNIITFGGNIWDLTGPINCPQAVEICGNGIDDDQDGLIDNQDQDCLCPTITPSDATTRTICEGETATFNVTSNAPNPPYSYIEFYRFDALQANPYLSTDAKTWLGEFANTNGTGTISSNNFPNNTLTNTTYYVYGCVKPAPLFPATCAPLVQYTVIVKPAATLSAGSDVGICGGTTATLTALASNAPMPFTYNWSNGLGAGASKTVTPATNTTYFVTVTAGNGCTTTDDVAVSLNPTPSVNAGADVSICSGKSTTLTAVGSGGIAPYTYDWDNGLGSGAVKTVAPSFTKTYTVTITSGNGCVATDQVKVTVTNCVENCSNGIDDNADGLVDCADPTCSITVQSDSYFSICAGQQVTMNVSATGGSGVFTYVWSHGIGAGQAKTVAPLATTIYSVTITPTTGCPETKTVQVVVVNCPENCSNGIDDDFDGLIDCEDPDCALVGAPVLVDDNFTTCPGTVYTDRVSYNDGNLQDPAYSISSLPSNGSVTIDGTGKFTYTPSGQTCGTDAFIYQVCNQATGCCAQATVSIHLGDTQAPIMLNMPPDLTISCDDAVPPPTEVLAFDACPGIYMAFSEETTQHVNGACESYDITRTWTATDLCGNATVGKQVIMVEDLTPPQIQRLYTLSNDKKLIAGNAALTSERWKYVSFPVTFGSVPLVFAQLTSEVENQAAVVQIRNISTQGFELKLMEQEASSGAHQPETVSWVAMQKGTTFNSSFGLDAGSVANATNAPTTVNFGLTFSTPPGLIAALQTTNEADASTPRFQGQSASSTQVFIGEEKSKDGETTHTAESMAYLAVTSGVDITDKNGDFVGETGTLSLTNAWATFPLRHKYTKPIVIMGGVTLNDTDPVTVRVKSVTPNDFQARLQEWTYQDGTHGVE
ncbi:MAG: Ig-like domain-containing protein, partial [Ferruginibacter sp.]